MKSNLLVGASVIALGLAMSPAFADVDVSADDTANGNGLLNDTQTDIDGNATNAPQTGNGNVGGSVLSDNGVSVDVTNDADGNGALNDTFQNNGNATNTPQTGNGNVGGDAFSNNTADDNSMDTEYSALGGQNAAVDGGSIDNVDASESGIAINDSSNVDIADGDIAGGSIDKNTASEDGLIVNDSSDINLAGGDVAEDGGYIEKNNVGEGSAFAREGSLALVVDDINIDVQTDVVASNTELNAYNVLNIGSGNAIYADESSAELTADASISGGASDSVMVQMSANSGANAITQQSQTITANIDNLTVN